jgi:hypothetical protein
LIETSCRHSKVELIDYQKSLLTTCTQLACHGGAR